MLRDDLQRLSDDLSNHAGSLDDADPLFLRNTANAMQTITHKITAQTDILFTYTHKVANIEPVNP